MSVGECVMFLTNFSNFIRLLLFSNKKTLYIKNSPSIQYNYIQINKSRNRDLIALWESLNITPSPLSDVVFQIRWGTPVSLRSGVEYSSVDIGTLYSSLFVCFCFGMLRIIIEYRVFIRNNFFIRRILR